MSPIVSTFIPEPAAITSLKYKNHADRLVYNATYEYTYVNDKDLNGLEIDAKKFIEELIKEDWKSSGEDIDTPWDEERSSNGN